MIYFAWVKERLGRDQETVIRPAKALTVGQLVEHLRDIDASYQAAFCNMNKLRFALDHDFVGPEAPLAGAKELAIFPPVTGG
ncbi:MoaD/ThiS family protein [Parasphingorhabdus sp.]|uniref:MoaD/ThiS family protein n=1 Tax=Parasphingorhabdus sp. TaxID=2709688 RepID=UPI002F927FE2